MAITVFANGDGLFHKGSGGSGLAFPDVCLSPPPPPTGPVPIPYPNTAMASDLSNGSTTVKVDGEPTALKDKSYVSTSSGDEGGTQGGNVITHKTKGKAYFQFWSIDVKIEGKNVDRHTDPMGQNCASPPPGGLTPMAKVMAAQAENPKTKDKCKRKYNKSDRHGSPTEKQKKAVNPPPAKKCWECKSPSPTGWSKPPPPKPGKPAANLKGRRFVADHQPPCIVLFYLGGCNDGKKQEKQAKDEKGVKPHCQACSSKQGGLMSGYSAVLAQGHGL